MLAASDRPAMLRHTRTLMQLMRVTRCASTYPRTLPCAPLVVPRHARMQAAAVSTAPETAVSTPAAATAHAADESQAPAFNAYIDFRFIRDNLPEVMDNVRSRNAEGDPALVAELYTEKVRLEQESDRIRKLRNDNSSKMKAKLSPEERTALVEAGKALKEELAVVEEKLVAVEAQLQKEGQKLPNMTHPESPQGGEGDAAVITEVGVQPQFPFPVQDHLQLGDALDIIDFETGAKVTGAKFYYLRRAGALLELALVNWTMSRLMARGFIPMMTPDVVREATLEKCGFQPRATNTQVYRIEGGQICLTGTAEVPLGGVYMDEILEETQLPVKMTAFGRCFRTEAGAAGSASKGLYRVHQFSKVEMFVICTPQQSEALLQELLDIEVELFTALGLHFKVLDMARGDLGAPAYRKFDVEAWMPGMERYGEISSASNCTDYQARRLNIRYRPKPAESDAAANGKKGAKKNTPTQFVHTLNATACAVPRMIVAILENFQQEDGSVVVPEVLRPYMGGIDVIRPPTQ